MKREGYTFVGWSTATSGTGTTYYAGDTFTIGTSDVTFYAQWRTYRVGDTGPAGGTVFYVDSADGIDDLPGYEYLEAAPRSTEWVNKPWGGGGDLGVGSELGVNDTDLGTGHSNTQDIVLFYGSSEPYENRSDYAANLAWNLDVSGYNDWFLPSRDELTEMVTALPLEDLNHGYHWSSSESNWLEAYMDGVTLTFAQAFTKDFVNNSYIVRAIRQF